MHCNQLIVTHLRVLIHRFRDAHTRQAAAGRRQHKCHKEENELHILLAVGLQSNAPLDKHQHANKTHIVLDATGKYKFSSAGTFVRLLME